MIALKLKTLIALGCAGFAQLDKPEDSTKISYLSATSSLPSYSYQDCYQPSMSYANNGTYSVYESPEQLRERSKCLADRADREEKALKEKLVKEEKCDKAIKELRNELWRIK